MITSPIVSLTSLWTFQSMVFQVESNPKSRPYVAYRGNPFDQDIVSRRVMEDGVEQRGMDSDSGVNKNPINRQLIDNDNHARLDDSRCPLSFRLGLAHSTHFGSSSWKSPSESSLRSQHTGHGTHTPPIIYPLHPDFDAGSGRQILLTTDYEMLEMWTPSNAIGTHRDYFTHKDNSYSKGGTIGYQSTEQLKEDEQFPLLFEGSSFYHSSPIVHDIEGDGVADAILGDYDGNLHFVGLDFEQHQSGNLEENRNKRRQRYYRRISIPRLYVRKFWFEVAINRTKEAESLSEVNETDAAMRNHTKWEEFEPYHTYFAGASDTAWRGPHDEEVLRGVTGNVLNMDIELARKLDERKRRSQRDISNHRSNDPKLYEKEDSDSIHRRLEEVEYKQVGVIDSTSSNEGNIEKREMAEERSTTDSLVPDAGAKPSEFIADDYMYSQEPELFGDDSVNAPPDGSVDAIESETLGKEGMDDYYYRHKHDYGTDDMYRVVPEGYNSYEEYQDLQKKYYHDSNYLRLPPHLLTSCTLVELPRPYSSGSADPIERIDELLLCAVSYYFDEDESRGKTFGKHANADGGDETEEQRGRYVASAILGYNLRWKYWSIQEVLDLSTDWSAPLGDIVKGGTAPITSKTYGGMGAWALATPIAVNLDGGDKNHIVVGTSMGLVYALDISWHNVRKGWPIQMRHPVEQKVLVEDIVGNTNLEVFVVDTGGDLTLLNADGEVLWVRNLLKDDERDANYVVRGTSPLSLGDVEGTGDLAVVLVVKIVLVDQEHENQLNQYELKEYRLYAINAITSDDLPHFPMSLGAPSSLKSTNSMPQPLLIDLHEDQRHWLSRINGLSQKEIEAIRAINVDAARQLHPNESSHNRPHGGAGRGLHIVQPLGQNLYIIEGSTSCSQIVDLGDNIPSMIMADDVHGTGGLDLVVTTSKGEILTLESDVVPYHPLNVWSAGQTRSPGSNAQAHGFSSKQGIFVHPISRQYRDILGLYVPITFEIFDRRPNILNEPNRQLYHVEIRAGMSAKRTIFSYVYNVTGVFTERVLIPYGPGYYSLSIRLRTSHGIIYEDAFHVGFNVNYMGGLWLIVCLPLIAASILIFTKVRKPNWEEDEDYGGRGTGILGSAPPP